MARVQGKKDAMSIFAMSYIRFCIETTTKTRGSILPGDDDPFGDGENNDYNHLKIRFGGYKNALNDFLNGESADNEEHIVSTMILEPFVSMMNNQIPGSIKSELNNGAMILANKLISSLDMDILKYQHIFNLMRDFALPTIIDYNNAGVDMIVGSMKTLVCRILLALFSEISKDSYYHVISGYLTDLKQFKFDSEIRVRHLATVEAFLNRIQSSIVSKDDRDNYFKYIAGHLVEAAAIQLPEIPSYKYLIENHLAILRNGKYDSISKENFHQTLCTHLKELSGYSYSHVVNGDVDVEYQVILGSMINRIKRTIIQECKLFLLQVCATLQINLNDMEITNQLQGLDMLEKGII
jgi:hypothetical protein